MPMPDLPALQFHSAPPSTEPVFFTIDDQRFNCKPSPGGGFKMLRMNRQLAEGGVIALDAVFDFFRSVMEPAEYTRFEEFVDSPDREISTELLGNIFSALWERYANRPTQPREQSANGQSPARPTLVAEPSTEASN